MAIEERGPAPLESAQAYNYASFTRLQTVGGSSAFKARLHAGEEAPDFELPTLDGGTVRPSDYRGRAHVVLEFGSIT